MTGFFNLFIFHFLQIFGTLKNYSTNVSEDDCVLTADTDWIMLWIDIEPQQRI